MGSPQYIDKNQQLPHKDKALTASQNTGMLDFVPQGSSVIPGEASWYEATNRLE